MFGLFSTKTKRLEGEINSLKRCINEDEVRITELGRQNARLRAALLEIRDTAPAVGNGSTRRMTAIANNALLEVSDKGFVPGPRT